MEINPRLVHIDKNPNFLFIFPSPQHLCNLYSLGPWLAFPGMENCVFVWFSCFHSTYVFPFLLSCSFLFSSLFPFATTAPR